MSQNIICPEHFIPDQSTKEIEKKCCPGSPLPRQLRFVFRGFDILFWQGMREFNRGGGDPDTPPVPSFVPSTPTDAIYIISQSQAQV